MKPVKLTMQGFGPYSGREIIDFSMLGKNNLFLITGPTGAGKTTILDAISYVLYGESSGNERSGEELRSHWSQMDLVTEVMFDFMIGNSCYRIRRQPKQRIPKKKGEGFRDVPPEAVLWKMKSGFLNENDIELISDKKSDVDTEIEKILGFKASQFRQVILLPQGRFRELLSAPTSVREEILQKLFGTLRFKSIEDSFREDMLSIGSRLKDIRERESLLLQNAGIDRREDLAEKIIALKNEMDSLLAEIDLNDKKEIVVHNKLNEALALDNKYQELQQLQSRKLLIDTRSSEMSILKDDITITEKILPLTGINSEIVNLTENISFNEKLLNNNRIIQKKKKDEFSDIENEYRKIELLEKEKSSLADQSVLLGNMLNQIIELNEVIANGKTLDSELKKHDESLVKMRLQKESISKQLSELNEKINSVKIFSAENANRKLNIESLNRDLQMILDKIKLQLEYQELVNKKSGHLDELEKLRIKKEKSITTLNTLESVLIHNESAKLAASLQDGSPCPVCGSLHHPVLATGTLNETDQNNLESVKLEIDNINKEERLIEDNLVRLDQKIEFLNSSRTSENVNLAEEKKRIEKEIKLLTEEFNSVEKYIFENRDSEIKQKNGTELLAEIEESLPNIEKMQQQCFASVEAERGRYKQLVKNIPTEFRDKKDVTAKLELVKSNEAQIAQRIKAIQQNYSQSDKELELLASQISNIEEKITGFNERKKRLLDEMKNKLSNAGLESEEKAARFFAMADRLDTLRKKLSDYSSEADLVVNNLNNVMKDISDKPKPDVVAVESEYSALKKEKDAMLVRKGELLNNISQCTKINSDLALLYKEFGDLEKKYMSAARLSDTANGNNRYNLTFQRYILGTLLDEVLMAASRRLQLMTRGRYTLNRRSDPGDRRKAAGLDLEVFDEFTGESRSAGTLSGGEGFLASLSLALGLADVVQQRSGGIYLDTIFIDEGFGTLDSETLDIAMDTLVDLQAGGRLVGVISHVAELSERISARLEVEKGNNGSTTRFIV